MKETWPASIRNTLQLGPKQPLADNEPQRSGLDNAKGSSKWFIMNALVAEQPL